MLDAQSASSASMFSQRALPSLALLVYAENDRPNRPFRPNAVVHTVVDTKFKHNMVLFPINCLPNQNVAELFITLS